MKNTAPIVQQPNQLQNKDIQMKLVSPAAKAVKLLLLFHALLIMLFAGGTLIGVGAWIATDTLIINDVCTVLGVYYNIALYAMLIIAGSVMLVTSFFGIVGTKNENACLMLFYQIVVSCLFVALLIVGILGFVFYQDLQTVVQAKLETAVTKYYGIIPENERYKEVTDAYDKIQLRFECCGAYGSAWNGTKSWFLYRNASAWYQVNTVPTGKQSPYVPNSCCKVRTDGQIRDKDRCIGSGGAGMSEKPPIATPSSAKSSNSDYLYEKGCYDSMKTYVMDRILKIAVIGLVYMLMLILGVIVTFVYLRMIAVSQFADNRYSRFQQQPHFPTDS